MWREDDDIHIIYTDNNEHIVYKNAYFVNSDLDDENSEEVIFLE